MSSLASGDGKGVASWSVPGAPMLISAGNSSVGGIPSSIPVMVTKPDGSLEYAYVSGLYDVHALNPFFDSVTFANLSASGAVDVANVIWIGDDTRGPQDQSNVVPWRAAEALQARDSQYAGHSHSGTSPMDWNSSSDIDGALNRSLHADRPHANGIGIIYGIRAIRRDDNYTVYMLGSVLHDLRVETEANDAILGPQLGIALVRSVGRFSARLHATVLAGFNLGDVRQHGTMGRGLVPGALNQPLYARTTEFRHLDRHDEFSPSGELRAEVRYRVTNGVDFSASWSGTTIGNALLAENRIDWRLPDFGIADPGDQSIFVQNFFCGIEIIH